MLLEFLKIFRINIRLYLCIANLFFLCETQKHPYIQENRNGEKFENSESAPLKKTEMEKNSKIPESNSEWITLKLLNDKKKTFHWHQAKGCKFRIKFKKKTAKLQNTSIVNNTFICVPIQDKATSQEIKNFAKWCTYTTYL